MLRLLLHVPHAATEGHSPIQEREVGLSVRQMVFLRCLKNSVISLNIVLKHRVLGENVRRTFVLAELQTAAFFHPPAQLMRPVCTSAISDWSRKLRN
mmetsp:Transcript_9398/g.57362  ORF Transcript_9398/g.57362 Transcript_9398/m.57362 type:complete len:97 (+) Transcript_9398:1315-1605(+)